MADGYRIEISYNDSTHTPAADEAVSLTEYYRDGTFAELTWSLDGDHSERHDIAAEVTAALYGLLAQI